MKKKILLGLGATTAVIAPLATVVACGSGTSDSGAKVGKIGKKHTKEGEKFINAFEKKGYDVVIHKANGGKKKYNKVLSQARIDTIKSSKLTAYDMSYLVFTNRETGIIKMTPFLTSPLFFFSPSEIEEVNNTTQLKATAKYSKKADLEVKVDLGDLSTSNNVIEKAANKIKAFQGKHLGKEYGYTVTKNKEVFTIDIYELKGAKNPDNSDNSDIILINELITKLKTDFKFNGDFIKKLGGTYIEGMPHDFYIKDIKDIKDKSWNLLYATKELNNKSYAWRDRVKEDTFQSWTQLTRNDSMDVVQFVNKYGKLKLIKTQFVYDQKDKKQYLRLIVQKGNVVKATYIDATPTQTFAEGDSEVNTYSDSNGDGIKDFAKPISFSSKEVSSTLVKNISTKIDPKTVIDFISNMSDDIESATASIKANLINLKENMANTAGLLDKKKIISEENFVGKVISYAKANETTTKVHFKTWVTSLVNLSYKELADPMNIGARGYSGIYALIDFYRIAAQYLDSL